MLTDVYTCIQTYIHIAVRFYLTTSTQVSIAGESLVASLVSIGFVSFRVKVTAVTGVQHIIGLTFSLPNLPALRGRAPRRVRRTNA